MKTSSYIWKKLMNLLWKIIKMAYQFFGKRLTSLLMCISHTGLPHNETLSIGYLMWWYKISFMEAQVLNQVKDRHYAVLIIFRPQLTVDFLEKMNLTADTSLDTFQEFAKRIEGGRISSASSSNKKKTRIIPNKSRKKSLFQFVMR